MKVKLKCDWCGAEIEKYPSKVTKHNFCSKDCLSAFSNKAKNPGCYDKLRNVKAMSANMTKVNRRLNPSRMTVENRMRCREAALGRGEQKGYGKFLGKLEHRVVIENIIGRELKPDEIVHHINKKKRDNSPENLVVLTRSEHSKLHSRERAEKRRAQKEVADEV